MNKDAEFEVLHIPESVSCNDLGTLCAEGKAEKAGSVQATLRCSGRRVICGTLFTMKKGHVVD